MTRKGTTTTVPATTTAPDPIPTDPRDALLSVLTDPAFVWPVRSDVARYDAIPTADGHTDMTVQYIGSGWYLATSDGSGVAGDNVAGRAGCAGKAGTGKANGHAVVAGTVYAFIGSDGSPVDPATLGRGYGTGTPAVGRSCAVCARAVTDTSPATIAPRA